MNLHCHIIITQCPSLPKWLLLVLYILWVWINVSWHLLTIIVTYEYFQHTKNPLCSTFSLLSQYDFNSFFSVFILNILIIEFPLESFYHLMFFDFFSPYSFLSATSHIWCPFFFGFGIFIFELLFIGKQWSILFLPCWWESCVTWLEGAVHWTLPDWLLQMPQKYHYSGTSY